MEKKECFGILDRVFPVGDKGLREVTPGCFQCTLRVSCLKEALTTREGIEMRTEMLDRSPVSGIFGRIRRWSERKELSRLAELDKKKRK
jgi:hypothetical protein